MSISTKKVQEKSKSDHSFFKKQENSKGSLNKQNSSAQEILNLHQTLGNQAVQRLFESGFIQGKLTIGKPNDKYEQEADRVADEVMRMPEPQVQRQSEEDEEEEMIQTKSIGDQITPLVQRYVESEEEEEEALQAKAEGKTLQVAPNLESRINALQGSGQPLSKETRGFFEPRFGEDFSRVRIHIDSNASQLARSINARAFTKGRDIVFSGGEYSPVSSSGKRLLGHELTHVVQQNHENRSLTGNKIMMKQSEEKGEDNTVNLKLAQVDARMLDLAEGSELQTEIYRLHKPTVGNGPNAHHKEHGSVSISHALGLLIQRNLNDPTDSTQCERDMRDVLRDWHSAVSQGTNEFALHVLSSRIDELSSGSWSSFMTSLLGSTIWAAAVFAGPANLPIFAVSMIGIGIASFPVIPMQSRDRLSDIVQAFNDYFDSWYSRLNGQLPAKAEAFVRLHPGATRRQAIADFIRASFLSRHHLILASSLPQVNIRTIRRSVVNYGKQLYDVIKRLDEAGAFSRVQRITPGSESAGRRAMHGARLYGSELEGLVMQWANRVAYDTRFPSGQGQPGGLGRYRGTTMPTSEFYHDALIGLFKNVPNEDQQRQLTGLLTRVERAYTSQRANEIDRRMHFYDRITRRFGNVDNPMLTRLAHMTGASLDMEPPYSVSGYRTATERSRMLFSRHLARLRHALLTRPPVPEIH